MRDNNFHQTYLGYKESSQLPMEISIPPTIIFKRKGGNYTVFVLQLTLFFFLLFEKLLGNPLMIPTTEYVVRYNTIPGIIRVTLILGV